jgi:hypothetical protein
MMEIRRPREPLGVWWKKCGTRNDSSAGSRPGRQASGGIWYWRIRGRMRRDFIPKGPFVWFRAAPLLYPR